MKFIRAIISLRQDSKVRYLLVGGSSVILEYGSFLLLVSVASSGVVLANAVSFLIGLIYTFLLHNGWTFSGDHTRSVKQRFTSYVVLAGLNLVLTSLLINVLVNVLHAAPFIAKIICMMLVVVWNYLLLNKLIFKR